MNCPVCKTVELKMSDRQGIEIDYCPQCRGVWLDRGELDKIIERSEQSVDTSRPVAVQSPPPMATSPYRDRDDDDDDRVKYAQRDQRRDQPPYERRDDDDRVEYAQRDQRRDQPPYERRDDDDRYSSAKPKRKGMLGELFNIFE